MHCCEVKCQLHCDILMFCRNYFEAIVQQQNRTPSVPDDGDHTCSDKELVILLLGAHLEAVLMV